MCFFRAWIRRRLGFKWPPGEHEVSTWRCALLVIVEIPDFICELRPSTCDFREYMYHHYYKQLLYLAGYFPAVKWVGIFMEKYTTISKVIKYPNMAARHGLSLFIEQIADSVLITWYVVGWLSRNYVLHVDIRWATYSICR